MLDPRLPQACARLAGRAIPYTLRESPRARRMNLRIGADTGLVVTLPSHAGAHRIAPFLRRHERWILRQIDRLARFAEQIPRRWPYGETLPYRGREHYVQIEQGARAAISRSEDRRFVVTMRRPGIDGARRQLKRWYREEAERALLARATARGQELGLVFRALRVRDQRRRWGSCSVRGGLSFNYRLIMAPPEVLDYVVVHELLHLRECNHSRRFWTLVARHVPGYQDARAWLTRFGPYLGV